VTRHEKKRDSFMLLFFLYHLLEYNYYNYKVFNTQ